jgi:hypothetical protein
MTMNQACVQNMPREMGAASLNDKGDLAVRIGPVWKPREQRLVGKRTRDEVGTGQYKR